MAFENVNVSSLKNALNQCKNSINHSKTDSIINNISNPEIWTSDSKINLNKALEKLITKYNKLEEHINKYINVASDIESYKILVEENKKLENECSSLNSRLYYTETYTETVTASDGTVRTETCTRTVKDENVENQINNINKKITENKEKMKKLEINVSNSI